MSEASRLRRRALGESFLGNLVNATALAFWCCGTAVLLALGWGASWTVAEWQFRAGLKKARADIYSRRFEAAGHWLAAQSASRPYQAEAAFLLGICEDAAGRHEAALTAWARVPPGSSWGPNAAIARARTLVGDLGRFTDAEAVLMLAVADADPRTAQHRYLLAQLVYWEGRLRMKCAPCSVPSRPLFAIFSLSSFPSQWPH